MNWLILGILTAFFEAVKDVLGKQNLQKSDEYVVAWSSLIFFSHLFDSLGTFYRNSTIKLSILARPINRRWYQRFHSPPLHQSHQTIRFILDTTDGSFNTIIHVVNFTVNGAVNIPNFLIILAFY